MTSEELQLLKEQMREAEALRNMANRLGIPSKGRYYITTSGEVYYSNVLFTRENLHKARLEEFGLKPEDLVAAAYYSIGDTGLTVHGNATSLPTVPGSDPNHAQILKADIEYRSTQI